VDRYCIVHHPEYHKKLSLKKIIISVPLVSFLNSIFLFIELETSCYDPKYDTGVEFENFLGVCEDGEKAYLRYSNIRFELGNVFMIS